MKRRKFLVLTSVSIAAVTLPISSCTSKNDVLRTPSFLLQLTNNETVAAIGRRYLEQAPGESKSEVLQQLILQDINSDQSSSSLSTSITKKVQLDFLNEKVVVVDGWVLAVTEARQAALNSLKT